MADRRKLGYIARFVVLGWVIIAAVAGIFIGLAHLLKNSTAALIVFEVIVYSAAFGFLGAQSYKWKGKRDGWPPHKCWGGTEQKKADEDGNAEDSAWG